MQRQRFLFAALGLLLAGFALAIVRSRLREGVVAAHVATLVVILFGTPVVLYDTVRYSWGSCRSTSSRRCRDSDDSATSLGCGRLSITA